MKGSKEGDPAQLAGLRSAEHWSGLTVAAAGKYVGENA